MIDAGLVSRDDDSAAQVLVHQELMRAIELTDQRIPMRCEVAHGAPGACLADAAGASMIVVGARGLGSMSGYLARQCAVPLVIVPGPARSTRSGPSGSSPKS